MSWGSTQTVGRWAPPTPAPAGPVGYAVIESPLGPLLAAATERGLVRLAYVDGYGDGDADGPGSVIRDLVDRVSPDVDERPEAFADLRRQLDAYFDGRLRCFDLPLDRRLVRGFRASVLEATASIPYGEVATYGEVARLAGKPGAARAAGGALGANPLALVIPCHRVVAARGIGGYGGRLDRKRHLLRLEGALPPELVPGPA